MRLGRGLLAATILTAAVAACGVRRPRRQGRRPRSPRRRARQRLPSPPTSAPLVPSRRPTARSRMRPSARRRPTWRTRSSRGTRPRSSALSRPDVFTCADLDATIFTDCASGDVLEGHPIGTAGGNIRVFAPAAYRDELEARMKAIDPSFSDDAGTGEVRVLGTSACGPDDPARRSYYVAWTAAGPKRIGRRRAPSRALRIHLPRRTVAGRHPLSGHRCLVAGTACRSASRRRLRGRAVGSRLTAPPQPNVKQYASAPASRNSISKRRSPMLPG